MQGVPAGLPLGRRLRASAVPPVGWLVLLILANTLLPINAMSYLDRAPFLALLRLLATPPRQLSGFSITGWQKLGPSLLISSEHVIVITFDTPVSK